MAEPKFFEVNEPLPAAAIAALVDGRLPPGADPARLISGVQPLDVAGPGDATFYASIRYASVLAKTRAGLCFCTEKHATGVPPGTLTLITSDPARSFAVLAARLYPGAARPTTITGKTGISPGAVVDPAASLEDGVTVETGAVIGAAAEIGRGTIIGPGAVIGPGVRIGRDCVVSAGAVVTNALIGNRVVVHPRASIGQDGFGYIAGKSGHTKVPQLGRVIIQDDVEIGANAAIDRGSNRDTVIGEGTKIDNLVQVAHNVVIGRHCLIAGQAGISGSVTIGDFVVIGGQAGIRDNVTVGAGAQIAALAGIHTDVPAGERWVGAPAQPMADFLRQLKALKRLVRMQAAAGSQEGNSNDG